MKNTYDPFRSNKSYLEELSKYKYIRLQSGLSFWPSYHCFTRIMVKNKWWYRYKIFVQSCWPEELHELWNDLIKINSK